MNAVALSSVRPGAPTRRLRILCAEDNPQVGDILVCLFSRLGHDVRLARDGQEAWTVLSRDLSGFDLVVTDHQMPGYRGTDLVGLLRQARFAGRIVVYSSSLTEHERTQYQLLRVDRMVEKSAVAADLLAAIAVP